jgi:exoribonuclease R
MQTKQNGNMIKRRNGKQHNNKTDLSGNNTSNESSNNGSEHNNSKRKARTKKIQYPPHQSHAACLQRYNNSDPAIIRGKIRVMPAKNGAAFVTCDRGSLSKDILILTEIDRNRALDGDYVFVELLSDEKLDGIGEEKKFDNDVTLGQFMHRLGLDDTQDCDVAVTQGNIPDVDNDESYEEDVEYENEEYMIDDQVPKSQQSRATIDNSEDEIPEMWHDDEVQMSLWDPVVNTRKKTKSSPTDVLQQDQRKGKVIFVIPPKSTAGKSELSPADESYRQKNPTRTIVGTLSKLPDGNNKYLFSPNNKALPRFMCPAKTAGELKLSNDDDKMLYKAEYIYGTWAETNKWPPCTKVTRLCGSCNVEDETKALLVEHDVDHGEFPASVLKDVEEAVKSGRFVDKSNEHPDDQMGWKPTAEMLKGRRDYRNHRVFTIDPTTARDLDDALHITELPDGRVEIGVHIADVSHFVKPGSAVDEEALRRATTVYLVDRVLPMLPRPLCEIACSLNENVERLAFSCVWRMNLDGTMSNKKGKIKADDVWYGRTVIKSCARLDYATAQNIIDKKVRLYLFNVTDFVTCQCQLTVCLSVCEWRIGCGCDVLAQVSTTNRGAYH